MIRGAFAVLLFCAVGWLSSPLTPATGLVGQYYANLSATGPSIAQTVDAEVSTDTLIDGPGGRLAVYSVEWRGALLIDDPGRYRFFLRADDGGALQINSTNVVSSDDSRDAVGEMALDQGIHPVVIRYRQNGGGQALTLRFAREGRDPGEIPAAQWLTRPMSLVEYSSRRVAPFLLGVAAVGGWLAVRGRRCRRAVEATGEAEAPAVWWLDQPRWAMLTLAAVAVATRLVMLSGTTAILWPDSDVFIETARSIARGRWLEHDPFRTLLYPYYLFGVLTARGWGGNAGQVIIAGQYVMGVLASMAFYAAGRRAFGSRVALAGAVLLQVHAVELFYESSVLSETLFTVVLSATVLLATRVIERPRLTSMVAVGVAGAFLTLTRPVGQWYLLAVLAPLLFAFAGMRQRLTAGVVLLATYATCMTPWLLVNQQQYGYFGVAIGTGLGVFTRVFEIDRSPIPVASGYADVADFTRTARINRVPQANWVRDELRRTRRYSTAQIDDRMLGLALVSIADDPPRFAAASLRQWRAQLTGTSGIPICTSASGAYLCSGRTEGYAIEGFPNRAMPDQAQARRWLLPWFRRAQLPIGAIGALAVFGAVACLARQRPRTVQLAAVLIALTVMYFTLVPALTQWPQDRYRLPVDSLLFMFAAAGLAALRDGADL